MKVVLFIILFSLCLFAPKSTDEWTMYPNPCKTYFNIETKTGILPAYIKIYDMNGRKVLEKHIGEEQMFVRIEIMFRPGSYIVYLEDMP